MVRRAKLSLVSGTKVKVKFTPVGGASIDLTLDPGNRRIDVPIRKEGGTLSLGCFPEAPGRPCMLALVEEG
jgi:hypothetical protein